MNRETQAQRVLLTTLFINAALLLCKAFFFPDLLQILSKFDILN